MNRSVIIPALLPLLAIHSCKKPTEKPNIIIILADDMGFSDIGCYGSEINTPNLDSLALEGMRMTQFYNASRSCPTRASLITGLYQHQAGVGDMTHDLGYPSYRGGLNNQCITFAELLKSAGYKTYMSGKWHVADDSLNWPKQRGFDRYYGLLQGATSYFSNVQTRNNKTEKYIMMADENKKIYCDDSCFYITDKYTDKAIQFIEEGNGDKSPFFLYLAYTAPHWPLHALPEDIARYRGKYMEGWDSIRVRRYRKIQSLGIINNVTLSPKDERVPDWESLTFEEKDLWDARMSVYAAMIDRLDQNIGRLKAMLRKNGMLDNTIIMFLSDNGACHEEIYKWDMNRDSTAAIGHPGSMESIGYPWANVSNTPFRMFKHWVHEGGISTPFIVRYPPMIQANSLCVVPSHIIDLMPTLAALSGAHYPDSARGNAILPMEGKNLLPYFKGLNSYSEELTALFWEHEGNRAVRKGNWKMVSKYNPDNKEHGPWELYNLENDRSELSNKADENPESAKILINWYNDWEKKVGVVDRTILLNRKK